MVAAPPIANATSQTRHNPLTAPTVSGCNREGRLKSKCVVDRAGARLWSAGRRRHALIQAPPMRSDAIASRPGAGKFPGQVSTRASRRDVWGAVSSGRLFMHLLEDR